MLYSGKLINNKVEFLREFNIPKPTIRNDFLTALDDATDDQATDLTIMIDSSYETQLAARQKAGKPCNDQMLQRLQKQYQGALTAMAGE